MGRRSCYFAKMGDLLDIRRAAIQHTLARDEAVSRTRTGVAPPATDLKRPAGPATSSAALRLAGHHDGQGQGTRCGTCWASYASDDGAKGLFVSLLRSAKLRHPSLRTRNQFQLMLCLCNHTFHTSAQARKMPADLPNPYRVLPLVLL